MTKTGNFEEDVRNGYYNWVADMRWQNRNNPTELANFTDTFLEDFTAFMIDSGVPEQYASKTASYVWDQVHSYGYHEALNSSYAIMNIFSPQF